MKLKEQLKNDDSNFFFSGADSNINSVIYNSNGSSTNFVSSTVPLTNTYSF